MAQPTDSLSDSAQVENSVLKATALPAAQTISNSIRLGLMNELGLDKPNPRTSFDRLAGLAGRFLKAPVALVSFVGRNHQYFKGASGLRDKLMESRCTPLSHSYCKFVVERGKPLIVSDARSSELLCTSL